LVRPDLKRALQAQRGDAVLGGSERPARVEPHRQRRTRTIEDRARGHRRAVRARGALPPAVRQPPTVDVPALIADETVRPAQPRQVVPAVRVRAEPRQELAHRSRIVLPASECNHGPKSTPVKWRALSPLNRVASPSEVADAVVYLASLQAQLASGSILDLNGASYL